MKIPFNKAPVTGDELKYIEEAIRSHKLSGDGKFTKKCEHLLTEITGCKKALLTPSCTAALELAALLIGIKEGDEVIVPSYTFVSTATAFALRGAVIVFVDIDKTTMNIDVNCIEAAITPKTRAIVPVHYAGVPCDMDRIMNLANQHDLFVVEDAAQSIGSLYKGKALGTIGHLGTFSFHETKNLTSGGEGGALLINDERFQERAEILREKGTNRSRFFRGQVAKYSWVDLGSSYLPSEIQAAYLYAQLINLNHIISERVRIWNLYYQLLDQPFLRESITLPKVPEPSSNNGHVFFIKVNDLAMRKALIDYLRTKDIMAVFHYVPLHSSEAGVKYGRLDGEDRHTTIESERLLRLPLFHGISTGNIEMITSEVISFIAQYKDCIE